MPFKRTKPINNCEMGILCVKDTVRHISSKDKDGLVLTMVAVQCLK